MDPYTGQPIPNQPYAHYLPTTPPGYPPAPQVVTKSGGLSGTAHAVHILLCLVSFGLWIPGYILFIVFTPKVKREVIVPFGADPAQVAAAYASIQPTMDERRAHNQKLFWVVMLIVGIPAVLYLLSAIVD